MTDKILEKISVIRKEMVDLGMMGKGIAYVDTLRCSHELDRLLNKYQKRA